MITCPLTSASLKRWLDWLQLINSSRQSPVQEPAPRSIMHPARPRFRNCFRSALSLICWAWTGRAINKEPLINYLSTLFTEIKKTHRNDIKMGKIQTNKLVNTKMIQESSPGNTLEAEVAQGTAVLSVESDSPVLLRWRTPLPAASTRCAVHSAPTGVTCSEFKCSWFTISHQASAVHCHSLLLFPLGKGSIKETPPSLLKSFWVFLSYLCSQLWDRNTTCYLGSE